MGLTQGQPQAREWLEGLIYLHTKGYLLGNSVGGLRVPPACLLWAQQAAIAAWSPLRPLWDLDSEHFLDMSPLVEFGVSLTGFSLYPTFPMC